MLEATCHCGSVRITIPRRPRIVTSCNCSICRRYSTLWAYYKSADVKITAAARSTQDYLWGDRSIAFVRCRQCGCVTHWQPLRRAANSRVGVNTRNFDPDVIGSPRVRSLDGALTWKVLI